MFEVFLNTGDVVRVSFFFFVQSANDGRMAGFLKN